MRQFLRSKHYSIVIVSPYCVTGVILPLSLLSVFFACLAEEVEA